MAEQPSELKKLSDIASDMGVPHDLRAKALETMGRMRTHEALLALLDVAANEKMNRNDRELALKYAMQIVKAGK